MQQTDSETLKVLSEAIDAYASAKSSGNESLVKFSIANLQQFLNAHVITPAETTAAPIGDAVEGE